MSNPISFSDFTAFFQQVTTRTATFTSEVFKQLARVGRTRLQCAVLNNSP